MKKAWGCLPVRFWSGVSVSKATREGDSSALGPWASASLGWELEGSPCLSQKQGLGATGMGGQSYGA